MNNLIKTDLKRIFKDKLFLIICIIGGVFAFVTPVLLRLIFGTIGELDDELLGMLAVNSKTLFIQSFNPASNFGMVLPILVAIILCKDFSHGTVRNKIICGKTRTEIFFSMFIASTIIMCGIVLVHALLTLGVSLIFFNYQQTPFTLNDLGYILLSVLFELLIYVCLSAFVCFLSVFMKNVGLVIVSYVAVLLVMSLIDAIFMVALPALEFYEENKLLTDFLTILSKCNIFSTAMPIGTGTSYNLKDLCCILIPTLFGSALWITLGIVLFKKKNLK